MTAEVKKSGAGRGWFFRVRVTVLLAALGGVLLYAWHDVASRRARTEWKRTLRVAVVLLEPETIPASTAQAFCARLPALAERLTEQARRYRAGIAEPFAFECFGPVEVTKAPPDLGGGSFLELAWRNLKLYRYAREIDDAARVDTSAFDSRVYVTVLPNGDKDLLSVEGASQQGGTIGTVSVELDAGMIDLGLMVVAHELFHTLGASDKYDALGNVTAPAGLAEPDQTPLYPQRWAEVMARNRPLEARKAVPPDTLSELGVGPETAGEIGWSAQ